MDYEELSEKLYQRAADELADRRIADQQQAYKHV